jgi:hypothetical protein
MPPLVVTKEIAQPRSAPAAAVLISVLIRTSLLIGIPAGFIPTLVSCGASGPRCRCGPLIQTSFDNFVDLAPVKPNAPALGTVINLYVLALGHHQVDATYGAKEALRGSSVL